MTGVAWRVRPTRGLMQLTIDGSAHDLTRLSPEAIVDLGVAMVPEGRRLFPKLTVLENLMLGAFRTAPRKSVACLVRASMRLDVNHRVAAAVGFKRLSFASSEEAAQLSGQEIGGVTLVALPADVPVLVDAHVLERASVIIGGGNRPSKVRLDPRELEKLPNVRIADIAIAR